MGSGLCRGAKVADASSAGAGVSTRSQELRLKEVELRLQKEAAALRKEEQLSKREDELRRKEDELRGQQDELRGQQDELRGQQDELRSQQNELSRKLEGLRTQETELHTEAEPVTQREERKRQDEPAHQDEEVNQEPDNGGEQLVSKRLVCKQSVKKLDLVDLKHIDEHILETPSIAAETPEALAEYFCSEAESDLEKVRAAYKWIVGNVAYDRDGLIGRREKLPCDPASILKNRMCVCEGYSNLMHKLCELLGVECKKVSGYSKDSDFNPIRQAANLAPEHIWNAVKVGGMWHLVDCTWGAGHTDDTGEFKVTESDAYFLTDPQIFVERHLPFMDNDIELSKRWQLLGKPIDLEKFKRRVVRSDSCLKYKVELVSHQDGLIEVETEVTLRFRGAGEQLTYFSAHWLHPGTHRTQPAGIATVLDSGTNEATVTARPPCLGVFCQLLVFGTTVPDSPTSSHLVTYHVKAQSQSASAYPLNERFYGVRRNPAELGFGDDFPGDGGFWIKADGQVTIRLPTSRSLKASCGLRFADESDRCDEFTFLQFDSDGLVIKVRMPRLGFYWLQLFCDPAEAEGNSINLFASFLLQCTKPLHQACGFPTLYTAALKQKAILVSPLDGKLPAHTEMLIEAKSPTLKKMMINKEVFYRSDSGFCCKVTTGSAGDELNVYGTDDEYATSYAGLFTYAVV